MQTKLFILLAAVMTLHYCTAAPSAYNVDLLLRPSPINPNIPMEPKPAETITFITDPKEIAKFKREIAAEATIHHITAPTTISPVHAHPIYQPQKSDVQIEKLQHHRRKRESKISSSVLTQAQQKPISDNASQKTTAIVVSSTTLSPKRRRATSTQATTRSTTTDAAQIKHRQKRENKDDSVPLIYRNQHKQSHELSTHSGSHESHESLAVSSVKPVTLVQQSTVRPHTESKRDIPVPLVPKHHHPEESAKADNKQHTVPVSKETVDAKTDAPTEKHIAKPAVQIEDLSEPQQQHSTQRIQQQKQQQHHHHQQQQTTTTSSIFRHRPVPVAELFAKGKLAETPEQAQHETN